MTIAGIPSIRDLNAKLLPETDDQWRERVHKAVIELRRDDLVPCRRESYRLNPSGQIMASIQGVLNEMAIRNGLDAKWTEQPHWEPEDNDPYGWPEGVHFRTSLNNPVRHTYHQYQSANPRTPTGSALPEALIWHGMKMTPEGQHYTSVHLLDAWVRKPLYLHGCQNLAELPIGMVNDMLYETKFHTVTSESINPLHAFADLMEALTEKPEHEFWDPAIAEMKRDR